MSFVLSLTLAEASLCSWINKEVSEPSMGVFLNYYLGLYNWLSNCLHSDHLYMVFNVIPEPERLHPVGWALSPRLFISLSQ